VDEEFEQLQMLQDDQLLLDVGYLCRRKVSGDGFWMSCTWGSIRLQYPELGCLVGHSNSGSSHRFQIYHRSMEIDIDSQLHFLDLSKWVMRTLCFT
jgi:hypothetical protein